MLRLLKHRALAEAPGLRTLLDTNDFSAWEEVVGRSLGHHRSRLLPHSPPFKALIRSGAVEEFGVLLLQGCGQVELLREQCGQGVLWLPLQGWSQETLNGQDLQAERGMGLLFRPGDVMLGKTSEEISGVSILLPEHAWGATNGQPSLLHQGVAAHQVIHAAWRLAEAAASARAGARFAAEALTNALHHWATERAQGEGQERVSTRKGHHTVNEACAWIDEHVGERFSVLELSQALQVSVRTLQYSFQQELGCSPMAHAKQLRLRRLRRLLVDPNLASRSIAELMQRSGLLACGATAADYRQWCGESPSRTRKQAWRAHEGP